MTRLLVLFGLVAKVAVCTAQTWAEVKGGSFAVPPEALAHVEATLKDHITAAVHRANHIDDWSGYLLQYKAVSVKGLRALEIHGSCRFDVAKFDTHAAFYDNSVSDGGECYFLVYYLIDSRRYSNVVFHGVA